MPSAKTSPKSKTTTKVKKTVSTIQRANESEEQARLLKKPEYKSFRLSKRIKHPKQLKTAPRIFKSSLGLLWKNKKLLISVLAVYLLLLLVFVRGFGGSNLPLDIGQLMDELLMSDANRLLSGITIFSVLAGSLTADQSESAGLFRSILLLIVSLGTIWGLRRSFTGEKIRIRDVFYKGMYPVVPFLLVLLTIAVQMIPIGIANFLYNVMIVGGVAATGLEQTLWVMLIFLFVLWSIYMITSSIFAIYIVTLPDMYPMKALRTAKRLVRHRRWTIMRRVIFLPFMMLLIVVVLVGPVILIVPGAAEWTFFIVSTSMIFLVHAYYYTLYRELIK